MFDLIAILLLIALLLWGIAGIVTNQVTGGTSWGHMPRQTKTDRRQLVEDWADAYDIRRRRRTLARAAASEDIYGEAS